MSHPALFARPLGRCAPSLCGLALALGLLSPTAKAEAPAFTLQAEGAGAFWLDDPQSDRFKPGLYFALRPGVALGDTLSLQWSYSTLQFGAADGFTARGASHALSAGVRVRPLSKVLPTEGGLGGLFVDANAGLVRTGELDRFGFDAGLGYDFLVTDRFGVGPVVRYTQIVQRDDVLGINPHDAQVLTAGVNLSFGPKSVASAECPTCEPVEVERIVEVPVERIVEKIVERIVYVDKLDCPDRDRDGVCDAEDRCPTTIGTPATFGCPINPCTGAPLMMLVQFGYDSASLPKLNPGDEQTMDPVLDAVAAAVAQDPSCRVCVMGHASEEGPTGYNNKLSADRATAVQAYLVKKGVASSRLPVIGMGTACQLEPHASRILNRRVDFLRLNEGEACPTTCPN